MQKFNVREKSPALFLCLCLTLSQSVTYAQPQPLRRPLSDGALPKAFAFDLPPELGKIETLTAGSGPTLFHIQEAHGHYESQKNIEKILQHLKDHYDVRLILLEGSAFKLHPELLRFYPRDKKLTGDLLDELAKKALVSGPELFLAEEESAEAYGIEDVRAYRNNGRAFVSVLKQKDKTAAFLRDLDRQIKRLIAPYLNKDLRHFLARAEDFHGPYATAFLENWIATLQTQALKYLDIDLGNPWYQIEWPMLVRVITLKKFEKELDITAFESERGEFFKILQSEQIRKLLSSPLSGHPLPDPETGRLFTQMIAQLPQNFDYRAYPHVNRYIGMLILQSEIKGEELMNELSRLEEKISQKLAETEEEKKRVAISRDYVLLKKLFSLELTPGEYEQILKKLEVRSSNFKPPTSNPPLLRPSALITRLLEIDALGRTRRVAFRHIEEIDRLYEKALAFYRGAKGRDKGMLKNIERLIKQGVGSSKLDVGRNASSNFQHPTPNFIAVVITGGFHAQPFADYFTRKGYNYALISPAMTDASEVHDYQRLILDYYGKKGQRTATFRNLPFIPTLRREALRLAGPKIDSLAAQEIIPLIRDFRRKQNIPPAQIHSELRRMAYVKEYRGRKRAEARSAVPRPNSEPGPQHKPMSVLKRVLQELSEAEINQIYLPTQRNNRFDVLELLEGFNAYRKLSSREKSALEKEVFSEWVDLPALIDKKRGIPRVEPPTKSKSVKPSQQLRQLEEASRQPSYLMKDIPTSLLEVTVKFPIFSNTVKRRLHTNEILTLGDLIKQSKEDLRRHRYIRHTDPQIEHIRFVLSTFGLRLKDDPDYPVSTFFESETAKTWWEKPVAALGITEADEKTLRQMGIYYVGELLLMTPRQLSADGMHVPKIAKRLQEALSKRELKFRKDWSRLRSEARSQQVRELLDYLARFRNQLETFTSPTSHFKFERDAPILKNPLKDLRNFADEAIYSLTIESHVDFAEAWLKIQKIAFLYKFYFDRAEELQFISQDVERIRGQWRRLAKNRTPWLVIQNHYEMVRIHLKRALQIVLGFNSRYHDETKGSPQGDDRQVLKSLAEVQSHIEAILGYQTRIGYEMEQERRHGRSALVQELRFWKVRILSVSEKIENYSSDFFTPVKLNLIIPDGVLSQAVKELKDWEDFLETRRSEMRSPLSQTPLAQSSFFDDAAVLTLSAEHYTGFLVPEDIRKKWPRLFNKIVRYLAEKHGFAIKTDGRARPLPPRVQVLLASKAGDALRAVFSKDHSQGSPKLIIQPFGIQKISQMGATLLYLMTHSQTRYVVLAANQKEASRLRNAARRHTRKKFGMELTENFEVQAIENNAALSIRELASPAKGKVAVLGKKSQLDLLKKRVGYMKNTLRLVAGIEADRGAMPILAAALLDELTYPMTLEVQEMDNFRSGPFAALLAEATAFSKLRVAA